MYSCFIKECHLKASTAEERKDHCISAHKFPPNFRFENLCLVGKKSTAIPDEISDEPMEDAKVLFLKTKSNFSFGHAKSKTFNKKSYGRLLSKSDVEYKNPLEDSQTVSDLLSSLPE